MIEKGHDTNITNLRVPSVVNLKTPVKSGKKMQCFIKNAMLDLLLSLSITKQQHKSVSHCLLYVKYILISYLNTVYCVFVNTA